MRSLSFILVLLGFAFTSWAAEFPVTVEDSGSKEVDSLVLQLVSERPAPYPVNYWPVPFEMMSVDRYCTPKVEAALQNLKKMGPRIFPALITHLRDDRYSYSIVVAAWNNCSVGDAVINVLSDGHYMYGGYKSRKTPSGSANYLSFENYLQAQGPEKWAEWAKTNTPLEIQINFIDWCIATENERGYIDDAQKKQLLGIYEMEKAGVRKEYSTSQSAAKGTLPVLSTSPATNRTVKVAAVQFISDFGNPDLNRPRLEILIRKAAGAGAKIVVLPETAITGYTSTDLKTAWQIGNHPMSEGLKGASPKDAAEAVPGESTRLFGKLAGELGIYLTIPFVEVDPKTGRYFNTIVLASPKGDLLLHYRKLNPWMWAEHGWTTPGDRGLQYVDTPYGRLGLLVCYDINFEPPRLKEAGVDTLLYCIAWVDDANSDWFPKRLPEIARQSGFNIVGANWTVSKTPKWNGYGHSLVIDRTGKTLARATNDIGETIIYADLPAP